MSRTAYASTQPERSMARRNRTYMTASKMPDTRKPAPAMAVMVTRVSREPR